MIDEPGSAHKSFPLADYRKLAELRFRIRNYLHFSEHFARTHGIEPQQHQLMLAIKGLPANATPTVSALANRLCLRHHSTVELINRLVERGAAVRKPCIQDRRQVLVELTPQGEELLAKLNDEHNKELQTLAPQLLEQLNAILTYSQPEQDLGSNGHEYSDVENSEPPSSSQPEKMESAPA